MMNRMMFILIRHILKNRSFYNPEWLASWTLFFLCWGTDVFFRCDYSRISDNLWNDRCIVYGNWYCHIWNRDDIRTASANDCGLTSFQEQENALVRKSVVGSHDDSFTWSMKSSLCQRIPYRYIFCMAEWLCLCMLAWIPYLCMPHTCLGLILFFFDGLSWLKWMRQLQYS